MLAYHFTEMPYPYLPEDAEERYGAVRIILPNRHFDPKLGRELYNRYLDEYEYAEELGLEIMLNEHHQTATCIDSVMPITAAALARRTKRARIVLLGSPLPHRDNPLRVAEEVAMLDVISGGRIVSGFVRGVGSEVLPSNSNPVQNRERFEEAHDLIIKAWTTHEPFHWEGKHFHFRYANPWPRPYQQPHPPVWITGTSPDNYPWIADHQYTVATFLTPWDVAEQLFNIYRARCRERGYPEPGPEKFAYLAMVYTGETDERAQEEGKKLLWYLHRRRPVELFVPPGYVPAAARAKAYQTGPGPIRRGESWEELQAKGLVICGSPRTVLKRARELHERLGVGHFLMMNQAGFMTPQETRRSMELFAREVYPELRSLGEPKSA